VAGPGDLADLGQLLADLLGGGHQPLGGQRLDMFSDLGPGLGVAIGPAPPLRLMTELHVPRPVGIIGTRPALGVVPRIAQRVKELLVPGRRNVECLSRGQLDTRGDGVDVRRASGVAVKDSAGGVLVGLQASKRRSLPVLDDRLDLVVARFVVRRPRDDPTGVAPLMRAAVGDLGDQERIAAQYGGLGAAFAVVVTLLEEIANGGGGAPLAMAQKFDMH